MFKRLTLGGEPFTAEQIVAAHEEWKFSCGPAALGALLGWSPDKIRPHFPDFEKRGFTNVTIMKDALRSIGIGFTPLRKGELPKYGLVRVQCDGPWMYPKPGSERWARIEQCKHTHWIASIMLPCPGLLPIVSIYDINFGLTPFEWWKTDGVSQLPAHCPGESGKWHATHCWELHLPDTE